MSLDADRSSLLRDHPYLVTYLAALGIAWIATVATWSTSEGRTPDLHQIAQAVQYLLVVLAATLSALQLRARPGDEQGEATLGFYDRRWSITDDIGARSFWSAVRIGALAMVVNVLIFIVADVLVAGGAAGIGTYAGWIGAAVGAGAIIGMVGALIALVIVTLRRRVRR